jgi:aspartate ammonia-lyase
MAVRTGIVALTLAIKHGCHLLNVFRPAIDTVIANAVTGNVITSAQSTTLKTWLDGMQAACDIIRVVSGY